MNTPPNSNQGGYVPPTPPPPSGNSSKQSPPPKGGLPMLPIIGIGVLLLGIIAFMFLGKKGGGNKGEADPLLGKWKANVFKIEEDYYDIRKDEDFKDFYLEFKEGNKLDFFFDELEEGTWKKSGDKVKIDLGEGEVYDAVLEDGVLDLDLITVNYFMAKEGSEETEKMKKIIASASILEEDEELEEKEEAIKEEKEEKEEVKEEKKEETPVAFNVNKAYWGGDWVGIYVEKSNWGKYETEDNMDMDLVGDIGFEESTQKPYLEIYQVDEEEPFISLYVDLLDTHINGKIGKEDAWVFNRFLTTEESVFFTSLGQGDPPTIKIDYKYIDPEDESSGIEFTVYLRKAGVPWDDMEKKPTLGE